MAKVASKTTKKVARVLTLDSGRGGAGPAALPLDGSAVPAKAAFSMRKLRTAHAGPCLQARRVVDDAVQDIGFDASGMLDTADLISFGQGGVVVIETWYDQSGNGYDLSHFNEGNMPQLHTGGTQVFINGKPAMIFDSTDDLLFNDFLPQAQPFMQSMVWSLDALGGPADFPMLTGNGPENGSTPVDHYVSETGLYAKAPVDLLIYNNLIAGAVYQSTTVFDGVNSFAGINKAQNQPVGDVGANGLTGFQIGSNAPVPLRIGELVIFNGKLPIPNLIDWEAAQGSFWGIP